MAEMKGIKSLVAATIIAAGGASTLAAADGDHPPRSAEGAYRHNVMELVKYSGTSILFGLQGKVAVPEDHYVKHARVLHEAAAMSKAAFEKDTRGSSGYSQSKDAIWENWDDFSRRLDAFEADTAGLVTAAESGDKGAVAAATKKAFGNCKGCHDKYRVDD